MCGSPQIQDYQDRKIHTRFEAGGELYGPRCRELLIINSYRLKATGWRTTFSYATRTKIKI